MNEKIDYSIGYGRWHSGDRNELECASALYDQWLGREISQYPADSNVLDYGCGFGLLTYYLKNRFDHVKGVDASIDQINVAKSNDLPVMHLPVEKFQSWALDNSETFDLIFLFDVLEHIPAPDQIVFLRLLVGTLKSGGRIYIKVPNANSMLAARWRYIDWTHTSSFTECSLDFVCLNSGLCDMAYLDDDSSIKPRYWWVPRWGIRWFYLRYFFRFLWALYLKSELGNQSADISVGYNLFARARKK